MSPNARAVDPRTMEWRRTPVAFQVRIWHATPAPTAGTQGWRSDDWELDGGDVKQVLHWAEERAAGDRFTISAVVDDTSGRGEILIYGEDPTRPQASSV
ncbi:MAG: hypothetical protein JWN67_2556 [Actinomycetia bacterium]|nr:hypothetical protein [Actinomycetes bacterium]